MLKRTDFEGTRKKKKKHHFRLKILRNGHEFCGKSPAETERRIIGSVCALGGDRKRKSGVFISLKTHSERRESWIQQAAAHFLLSTPFCLTR